MDSGPRTAFQLGNYNCVERLRANPIGVEFRAKLYRLGGVETQFAVTRLHPHLDNDARFVARLAASVKIQSQLDHEAIGKTLALEAGGGDRFLVADFVHGLDLKQLRALLAERREALSPGVAASIIADVVSAVDHAHRRTDLLADGVVHAGLSPSTVMLTAEGGVKVTGVGLLRAFQQGSWTADPALEEFLPFLSPECLNGEPPQISSDIWALGALLWELSCGAPPFPSATLETIGQAFQAGPGAPPGGETALLALARRCLKPIPAERFSSVAELGSALEAWLGDRRANAVRERAGLSTRVVTRPRSTGIFQAVAPGEWAAALAPLTPTATPALPRKLERIDAHQGWTPPLPGRGKSDSDDEQDVEIETVMEIEAELDDAHVARPRPAPPPLPPLPTTDVFDLKELAKATAEPPAVAAAGDEAKEKGAADLFQPLGIGDTDPTWRKAKNASDLFEPIGDADPTIPKPKLAPALFEPIGDADATAETAAAPLLPVSDASVAGATMVDIPAARAATDPGPTGATAIDLPAARTPAERPPAILLHAAAAMTATADDIFSTSPSDEPAHLFAPSPADEAASLFAPGAAMESTESMPSIASLAARAIIEPTPFVAPPPPMFAPPEPLAPSLPPPPPLPAPPIVRPPPTAIAARPAPKVKSRVALALAVASGLLVVAAGVAIVKWAGSGEDATVRPIPDPPPMPQSPPAPAYRTSTPSKIVAPSRMPVSPAHVPPPTVADQPPAPHVPPPTVADQHPALHVPPPAVVDEHPAPVADGGSGLSIASEPAGAALFVDGIPRGATPQPVDLTAGRHRVVIAGAGRLLWKRDLDDSHGKVLATLEEAHPALGKGAGLKVRCKSEARIFVDGSDTGAACPNERRIEVAPGAHKVSIYLLRTGHTVERDVDLPESSDSSARVYFK